VLWEQFLVYAVVFGIADQVTRAMTVKVPEVVEFRDVFPRTSVGKIQKHLF